MSTDVSEEFHVSVIRKVDIELQWLELPISVMRSVGSNCGLQTLIPDPDWLRLTHCLSRQVLL
jgi:hypothetical protein